MSYREQLARNEDVLELLLQLPGEGVGVEELVNRLEGERQLFESLMLQSGFRRRAVSLVVIVDDLPGRMLELTLRLWGIQSCPIVRTFVVPTAKGRQVGEWLRAVRARLGVNLEVEENWAPARVSDCEFVVFARAGDMLHPSLAATLVVVAEEEKVDIVVWNDGRYVPSGKGVGGVRELLRRPRLERHTLRHLPYIGTAFAARPRLLLEYPYPVLDHVREADAHPFHLWAAEQVAIEWWMHPEYLTLRPVGGEARPTPGEELFGVYQRILRPLTGDFLVKPLRTGTLPYRLEPRGRASKISVAIPFRDRPEETCRCLRSVLKQEVSGKLEVVLVDNNSTADSRARIERVAAEARGYEIQVIGYPHPFNHSRECMLGAEVSTGDVVVFLNNDAELVSRTALEEMAAWALLPHVATVGCRITSPDGSLVCAGIRAEAEGFCRESKEAAYSTGVRESLGNTFACAAVSREALRKIGPLDDIGFPNGYNDVEWCLRARRAGYRHIYLGHLRVDHRPATSRDRSDESLQRVLLQVRFPELAQAALFQLERRATGRWAAPRAAALVALGEASRSLQASAFGHWLRRRRALRRAARLIFRGVIRLVGGSVRLDPAASPTPDGALVRLEAVGSCPNCASRRSSSWRTGRDINFRMLEGAFPYVRCRDCGLVYLALRPVAAENLRAYPNEYPPYAGTALAPADFVSPVGHLLAKIELRPVAAARRWIRACLEKVQPDRLRAELQTFYRPPRAGAVLLDFGCGSALFLDKARSEGWETIGLDASPEVIREVQRQGHRAALTPQGWDEIDDLSIDAVRLNHVLEHLYDPQETLAKLYQKLRRGGGLHIATPNPSGLSAMLFRSCWYSLETPRHVMLYPSRLLRGWLERLGFVESRVVPELTAKDFARSLGHALHRRGRVRHDEIARMPGDGLLRQWAELAVVMSAVVGRPDRYHVFAKKP